MCQQRQRDVAVPALPAPDLVLVQSAIACGCLEAALDLPAPARHLGQHLSRRLAAWGIHHVIGQLPLLVQATSNQEVMPEATLLRRHLQPPPWRQRPPSTCASSVSASLVRSHRRACTADPATTTARPWRPPSRMLGLSTPTTPVSADLPHTPHRPPPRHMAPRRPAPAPACAGPVPAWWQTPPPRAHPPPRSARDPRTRPWVDTAPGQRTHLRRVPHSRGIRRSGCSRCDPPYRFTGAALPPSAAPS